MYKLYSQKDVKNELMFLLQINKTIAKQTNVLKSQIVTEEKEE